jgi:hypothetical protein
VKTLRAPLWLNEQQDFKHMLIIVDNKISNEAKTTLSSYGELLELSTEGITYPAISGHPDIFFCQLPGKLIVAPNLPKKYFDQLDNHRINYINGELPVGPKYPSSARYNAVATSKFFIHNLRLTDPVITRAAKDLIPIHVDQGYCRCNLLPLKDDHFITSDKGIYKFQIPNSKFQISNYNPHSTFNIQNSTFLYVSPEDILLEGFPHGFFGGCCGVWEDKVFINGSLKFFKDGEKVRDFLTNLNYKIIELYIGPLVDTGSIFFLKNP